MPEPATASPSPPCLVRAPRSGHGRGRSFAAQFLRANGLLQQAFGPLRSCLFASPHCGRGWPQRLSWCRDPPFCVCLHARIVCATCTRRGDAAARSGAANACPPQHRVLCCRRSPDGRKAAPRQACTAVAPPISSTSTASTPEIWRPLLPESVGIAGGPRRGPSHTFDHSEHERPRPARPIPCNQSVAPDFL